MNAQSKLVSTRKPDGEDHRSDMVNQYMDQLHMLACRASQTHHWSEALFVSFCIAVDSRWQYIVDDILPDMDWQQYRDAGLEPMARGVMSRDLFCAFIEESLPDIVVYLASASSKDGSGMHCVVLDDEGGTIYRLRPIQ